MRQIQTGDARLLNAHFYPSDKSVAQNNICVCLLDTLVYLLEKDKNENTAQHEADKRGKRNGDP